MVFAVLSLIIVAWADRFAAAGFANSLRGVDAGINEVGRNSITTQPCSPQRAWHADVRFAGDRPFRSVVQLAGGCSNHLIDEATLAHRLGDRVTGVTMSPPTKRMVWLSWYF